MGNEYLGTTLGYFKLFLDRNRLPLVVKVKLWLVDQDGRPTNRLTYEFDPASAPRLEGGQKTPVLDDLLKEHNAKVAVAH
jgi:hypothetical protein